MNIEICLGNAIRENETENIVDELTDYVVIDLETTGFSPASDKIIEIAAIVVVDNEIVDRYDVLVNPQRDIPDNIVNLTGITNNMVKNSPIIDKVIPEFLSIIDSYVIVGHNVNFDLGFISENCEHIGIKFEKYFVDTLKYSRKVFPELEHHKLGDVCSALNIENKMSHRALSDCIATHECFQKLMEISTIPIEINSSKPASKRKRKIPKYTAETQSLQTLQGLLLGVTCDNVLTDDEVYALKSWLDENRHLCGNYPFDRAEKAISAALEDGILEQHELDEMLVIFKELSSPDFSDKNDSEIEISGKIFCLSGEFESGTKDNVASLLESKGAIIKNNVSGKTDYLIVGGLGSKDWKCGNYGSKIKKALELQEKGGQIVIFNEKEFFEKIGD